MSVEDMRSREDLRRFLADLSDDVRAGRIRVESETSADLLAAA
jgi:hypothetical protein